MAERPVRLQLSRRKGFRLQALSLATNGLPAVNCTRLKGSAGMWGNWAAYRAGVTKGQAAVDIFQRWVAEEASEAWKARAAIDLRGNNLACHCGPDDPCHVDVLLEIANGPATTFTAERRNIDGGRDGAP